MIITASSKNSFIRTLPSSTINIFLAVFRNMGGRSTRDASQRKSRRLGIFMPGVTILRYRGGNTLECDSIPERKIDRLPVILYVSFTKKFIRLREDKVLNDHPSLS
jgi:hypothetical protein